MIGGVLFPQLHYSGSPRQAVGAMNKFDEKESK